MDGTEPDLWMSISRRNHTTSNTNRVSLLIILILTNLFTRQTLLYYISDCRLAESIGLLFGGAGTTLYVSMDITVAGTTFTTTL